ncbi:hypothetical protein F5Y18DRAFT_329731 [Xylariaceae sp. FL1019]|nr:hypothetical protein F5Y18DRAFT_329731 [Xylariaceae sp. FL1019]
MAPRTRKKVPKASPADQSHQKSPQSQQQAADLPNLFPAYDGSYGINTLLDTDAKGQKTTRSGITNEKSDDQKWTRYMQGGRGKKYSMDSDLKNAINTGNEEVERDHQGSEISDPTDSGSHPPDSPSTNTTHPVSPTNTDYVAPSQSYIPQYDPRKVPFLDGYDRQPKQPYTRAQLPSVNENAVIGVSQPKAPPYERIPFYGLPQGQGAKEPFSPVRPDTSRSFNFESGLFSNATVETPAHRPTMPAKEPEKPRQTHKPQDMPMNIDEANQAKLREYAETKRKAAQADKENPDYVQGSHPVHTHQHTVDQQFSLPQPDSRSRNTATAMKRPEPRFDSPKKKDEDNEDKNGLCGKALYMLFIIVAAIMLVSLLKLLGLDSQAFRGGLSWSNMKEGVPSLDSVFSPKASPGAQSPSNVDYDKLAKELRKDMPDNVWVQKDKRGRLKIPEDFWHALRDLITDDDMILVLENARGQPPGISNDHWAAVKSRIEKSGLLSSGKGSYGDAHASIKDASVSQQSWETWLEHNAKSLKTSLRGAFITKDEFMELFDKETSSYQNEITKELAKQQDRIREISNKIASIVDGPGGPGGGRMSKSEVKQLVDNTVTKAINKVKLGAIANGRNEGHESDLLLNQVNFFSYGAGARITPDYISPAWEEPKTFWNGKKWIERTYRPQPPSSAVSTWAEEGECFCAGPDRKGFGQGTNNISVILGRDIIPQNLVVEHILPGATLDPGAMPKEIELWAYIEEVTLRNEVKTFSETQFPNTPKEQVLDDGWVKIGHFNYESDAQGKGARGNRRTEVFPLKSDLTSMNAVTNQLVVRALNNHGADHTCFYRLGLFGEMVERPEDYTWDQVPQKSGWFW